MRSSVVEHDRKSVRKAGRAQFAGLSREMAEERRGATQGGGRAEEEDRQRRRR